MALHKLRFVCRECNAPYTTAYQLQLRDQLRDSGDDTSPVTLVCPKCQHGTFEAMADRG